MDQMTARDAKLATGSKHQTSPICLLSWRRKKKEKKREKKEKKKDEIEEEEEKKKKKKKKKKKRNNNNEDTNLTLKTGVYRMSTNLIISRCSSKAYIMYYLCFVCFARDGNLDFLCLQRMEKIII